MSALAPKEEILKAISQGTKQAIGEALERNP
jgi:hypothetical protein